ncbi:hypothetical protein TIFTF001_039081 [Ficus carica]|uniref:Uncharacterized protein n=1 Tax=Ficus carica TaxID=3494 RepID=A0AA88EA35_FICCA|nr:hypothetical protein TIFTF001_039080 [Ficus carica]GMN70037.1 hypothetical protein TIFTF001_039081 [Ficus carica]
MPQTHTEGKRERAEYWINQDKEARAQIFKAKKEEKAAERQLQPRQNQYAYAEGQTSNAVQHSKQFGKNKRKGNATGQGQQRNYPQKKSNRGHYARNCTFKNQNQNPQYPNRNASSQLHAVQAKIEDTSNAHGRLEAPGPQARIYAYTKGDAEAGTTHVVTVQVPIGPVTTARAKKFKDALNGLIRATWSQAIVWRPIKGITSDDQPNKCVIQVLEEAE